MIEMAVAFGLFLLILLCALVNRRLGPHHDASN